MRSLRKAGIVTGFLLIIAVKRIGVSHSPVLGGQGEGLALQELFLAAWLVPRGFSPPAMSQTRA